MPVLDKIHPATPLLFVKHRLDASDAWREIHDDRLYEDVRFPHTPDFPLGVVKKFPTSTILLWTGSNREYIGKLQTRLHIYSVRQYPNGAGTWMDFGDSFHALREALTGVTLTPVNFNNVLIGTVFQSRLISEISFVDQDDDVETLYHGIAIEVVHK